MKHSLNYPARTQPLLKEKGLLNKANEPSEVLYFNNSGITYCVVLCSEMLSKYCHDVISVMSDSVWPCGLYPARLFCLWDSSGKNTGAGCHFLLQRIIPIQEWTRVSYLPALAGGFVTTIATWEAPPLPKECGVSISWVPLSRLWSTKWNYSSSLILQVVDPTSKPRGKSGVHILYNEANDF